MKPINKSEAGDNAAFFLVIHTTDYYLDGIY